MTQLQYMLVKFDNGQSNVTAFLNGKAYTADSSNPRFEQIVTKLQNNDPSVENEFDLANLANKAFHEVTDRVSVRHGKVFLDENEVDSAMSGVIVGYLREGNENLMPLVKFLERLEENPSFNSRNQFWQFVRRHGIHIDDEGYVIMYKAVWPTSTPGVYRSSKSGRAFVNGQEQNGQIHTSVGDIVTMPRREISDDPSNDCHAGLHAGAKAYAESFKHNSAYDQGTMGVMITVRVDPSHVVSVPNGDNCMKVRVERYEIMDVLGDKNVDTIRWGEAPSIPTPEDKPQNLEGDCCDDCGDPICEGECVEGCWDCGECYDDCNCPI